MVALEKSNEVGSGNPRERQRIRYDNEGIATETFEEAVPNFNANPINNQQQSTSFSTEQMLLMMQQQQQQMQLQMHQQQQQNQNQMNMILQMINAKNNNNIENIRTKKKDPPTYHGKQNEDLGLWIFLTEEYYANHSQLMKEDSEKFVQIISSSLDGNAKKWYRTYSIRTMEQNKLRTWEAFKIAINQQFQKADPEYHQIHRLATSQQGKVNINDYTATYQDLIAQIV